MRTNEEIEAFLLQMGRDFTAAGDGVWVIHDDYEDIDNIVICNAPPVISFRVKLMEIGEVEDKEELFKLLLTLNASDMVAGAYGLEGENIVITDTLQTENLDLNELQASIDGFSLAISIHYPVLSKYLKSGEMSEDAKQLAAFDAQLSDATANA